jgi:peptide/nickel transport system permease protein
MSDAAASLGGRDSDEETPVYRKGLGVAAWLGMLWLGFISAAAILAPFLPLDDPNKGIRNPKKLSYFQEGFIFGTDEGGRDVLSRVINGGSASLTIALISITFGTLIDILLAFPPLLLALTLVSVLSPASETEPPTRFERILIVALAVGLVSIPILARITRANTLQWSQREFVMAARAQGAKPLSVMFREVLPNVVPAMLSIALLGVATVIITEGGLALFGLSVIPPDPSWGSMVASQIDDLDITPHVWIVPSVIIFLTVMSLNLLGDVVRDRFSVREAAI